ncbi:Uma2 family endonuclease [Anaerosporobacter sp.]|uniref:Uma2 family endonuclease n=1 Tax=Anaerosporobacter sp. TaxID=1872529 RepID=UPI00286F1B68|nr:Uma2 family endonuclease [Anaerosporobacter sp.]
MPLPEERIFTIDDINNLPEGQRAELIDGTLYMQASPSRTHQLISSELHFAINEYIKSKKGKCMAIAAPFDIFLNGDESECFIPDISVICNPDIIKERGCYGAPDWVVEITSPSTVRKDYFVKSIKYQEAGIKEYWIINPTKQSVTVYDFREDVFSPVTYTFRDKIKVNIYDDFEIDFGQFNF